MFKKAVMNKTVITFFLTIFICSCSSTVNRNSSNYKVSNCPPDGICSLEVMKKKSIVIDVDENNAIHYTLADDPQHSVIIYNYKRNTSPSEVDGGYREVVLFEIDAKIKKQNLSNEALQSTKMLFGRFCFCRGQNGLFKIKEGNLDLNINKDNLDFKLDFKINEVPQVTSSIKTQE